MRIKSKPQELANQCMMATSAISACGEDWPTTAPGMAELGNAFSNLNTQFKAWQDAEAALAQARTKLASAVSVAQGQMRKIDSVTDGLYGPTSSMKESFGLPAKKPGGRAGQSIVLTKIIVLEIAEGNDPASIYLRFQPIKGASYQAEWFADPALTELVGNIALTDSKLTATGLTTGKQYWFRVRAVKGGKAGPWSDAASRVANI